MKLRTTTRATTRTRAIANEAQTSEELNFWGKMRQAYRIFFPPSAEENARNEAKKRLRMILVADRCTMSESSMDEMKAKIMTVVGEFVDVDDSQEVDVSMNTDEELGTMYAVSIPVKRVKAEYERDVALRRAPPDGSAGLVEAAGDLGRERVVVSKTGRDVEEADAAAAGGRGRGRRRHEDLARRAGLVDEEQAL